MHQLHSKTATPQTQNWEFSHHRSMQRLHPAQALANKRTKICLLHQYKGTEKNLSQFPTTGCLLENWKQTSKRHGCRAICRGTKTTNCIRLRLEPSFFTTCLGPHLWLVSSAKKLARFSKNTKRPLMPVRKTTKFDNALFIQLLNTKPKRRFSHTNADTQFACLECGFIQEMPKTVSEGLCPAKATKTVTVVPWQRSTVMSTPQIIPSFQRPMTWSFLSSFGVIHPFNRKAHTGGTYFPHKRALTFRFW